jgi:Toprim-like
MTHYSIQGVDRVNSKEWKAGGQERRICPNCGDTKKHNHAHASLAIDPKTGKYWCHRCQIHGTLIDYWETIARCPYCNVLAEDIQRAEIWKQWKTAGRRLEDRAKTEKSANQVIGLQVSESGAWNCWSCNAAGQLRAYAGRGTINRVNQESQEREQRRAHVVAVLDALTHGGPNATDEDDNCKWLELWQDSIPLSWGNGLEYLNSRGIHFEGAQLANVRYHQAWGRTEKWAGHPAVLFPYCDRRGKLVAVAGRLINPSEWCGNHRMYGKKSGGVFVTSPDVWKADAVAITEAPIDALVLSYWSKIPAIACGGTSWPDWLPPALIFKQVVLATDNDDAGDKMAEGLRAALDPYTRRIERIKPEGVKDWGELAERGVSLELPPILEEYRKKAELIEILTPKPQQHTVPYLTADDEVRIPFSSDPRYHWWNGGQSIYATLAELSAPLATWSAHGYACDDLLTNKHADRCRGDVRQGEGFAYCVECGRYTQQPRGLNTEEDRDDCKRQTNAAQSKPVQKKGKSG